jgi:O-antigen/teichoic acid export membrane protein
MKAKKIARNILILYGATIIGHLLTLGLILTISRMLGAEGLGKYSFVIAFVGIFSFFSDFGITILMKKDLVKNPNNKVFYVGNILGLKFIINIAVTLLCLIAIYFVDKSFEVRAIVLIYAFTMFLEYLNWVFYSLYQVYQKIEYQALIITIERIISTFGGVFLLLLGQKLISIFIIIFLSYLICFLISLFITNKNILKIRPSIDIDFSKNVLTRAFPFWFSTIFLSVYFRIDTVLLKFFKTYDIVGLYNAAYKLIDGLSFLPAVITIVIFPAMVKFHTEDAKKLQILFQTVIKYLFIISFPIAIGITLVGDRIIYIFYGKEFAGSVLALQILTWAEILVFTNTVSGQLLNAIDKEKAFAVATGLGLVFNVVLNLLLIPFFSFIGSAIAVLLTEILFLALYYINFRKKGYSLNVKNIGIVPLIAGSTVVAVLLVLKNLNLFLLIPFTAIVYFSILFFGKSITREEINLFGDVLNLPFLKNFK